MTIVHKKPFILGALFGAAVIAGQVVMTKVNNDALVTHAFEQGQTNPDTGTYSGGRMMVTPGFLTYKNEGQLWFFDKAGNYIECEYVAQTPHIFGQPLSTTKKLDCVPAR